MIKNRMTEGEPSGFCGEIMSSPESSSSFVSAHRIHLQQSSLLRSPAVTVPPNSESTIAQKQSVSKQKAAAPL